MQAGETDHICPYASVYKATRIYQGERRFVLAGSGHIAGVVNPPSAQKYHYYTNDALPETAAEWLEGAQKTKGSWWPDWHQWASAKAGKKNPARKRSEEHTPELHSLMPTPTAVFSLNKK